MKRSGDPRLLRALLSHRVLVLSNTLARAASRYYPRRFGVRLAEWRVIDALHAGPGISANQISQWLLTDKAWVGRSVERLIAAGYVRRWPDPTHGRRQLLRLTAKGERAYAAISVAARRRHENLLGALSAAEREALERALVKLQARAAAMLAAPDLGFGSAAGRGRARRGESSRRRIRTADHPMTDRR
jgi:DNA-binding MarR family transcriptional regulator